MGFTIEDMRLVSEERYKMEFVAGRNGWSNSISWLLMLEDLTIIQHFTGKELAVTTGLGFQTEEEMMRLVEELSRHSASGLIFNTGFYVMEIPASVLAFCDENDLPLLLVPWEISVSDMIKDLSIRVFLQTQTDEQISNALIHAIETPEGEDLYMRDLLPHFDLDGSFQVALITADGLDSMDTVERKRLAYRIQLYITNITHNGHFFYYASCFVLVMNAMTEEEAAEIMDSFAKRAATKFTDVRISIGVSDIVRDIRSVHTAYKRAEAALNWSRGKGLPIVYFREMGLFRLISRVEDEDLLRQMSDEPLAPLLAYDREHGTEFTETLKIYLQCGGSIKSVSEKMFIHRNTILYRMGQIREILGTDLESQSERMKYLIAFMIREMPAPEGSDPSGAAGASMV